MQDILYYQNCNNKQESLSRIQKGYNLGDIIEGNSNLKFHIIKLLSISWLLVFRYKDKIGPVYLKNYGSGSGQYQTESETLTYVTPSYIITAKIIRTRTKNMNGIIIQKIIINVKDSSWRIYSIYHNKIAHIFEIVTKKGNRKTYKSKRHGDAKSWCKCDRHMWGDLWGGKEILRATKRFLREENRHRDAPTA